MNPVRNIPSELSGYAGVNSISNGVKLLICTQKVDRNDPALGFFHRWIEEFAKHGEKITVICLEKGKYELPSNVSVYSLGKEQGVASRIAYARRFRKLIREHERDYDAVFVHMNPEYIVLGGAFWRRRGKKIVLWYVHKSVTLWLRLAMLFVDAVFTASEESFRLKSKKVRVIGHGIDTIFFSPDPNTVRTATILSVGRLMPSKRHDLAIRAAAIGGFALRVVGEGEERVHLERLAHELRADVHFAGALSQEGVRDEYRRARFLIHASETGSMDKVVLEALATDLPVITTNQELAEILPVRGAAASPEAIAAAVRKEDTSIDRVGVVRKDHSLSKLVETITSYLRA